MVLKLWFPISGAVPFNKKDILKEEIKHDSVDYFTGNLVFEEGDKSILPK